MTVQEFLAVVIAVLIFFVVFPRTLRIVGQVTSGFSLGFRKWRKLRKFGG